MSQTMLQLGERLFEGYASDHMSKGELTSRASGMGLPQSILSHLGGLPEGQVNKQQVQDHLAKAQGTSLEQDIMHML